MRSKLVVTMEGGSIGLGVPRLSTPLALIVCYLIRLRWEEHLDCWASIVNRIMQKSKLVCEDNERFLLLEGRFLSLILMLVVWRLNMEEDVCEKWGTMFFQRPLKTWKPNIVQENNLQICFKYATHSPLHWRTTHLLCVDVSTRGTWLQILYQRMEFLVWFER